MSDVCHSPIQKVGIFAGKKSILCLCALVFVVAWIPRCTDLLGISICYDELAAKDSGPILGLLLKGDFQSEGWAQYPYFPFYKYVYGVIPQIFGSNPSDPGDLLGARIIGSLLGAAMVAATFLIGTRLMSVPAALVGALLLAFFPSVLGHDRIALHDAPSRLLSLLAWWFLLRWHEKEERCDFILGGLFSGLAIIFFHRTGVTSGLAMGIWLTAVLVIRKISIKKGLQILGSFAILSLGTFILGVFLLWPYLWFRPWEFLRWYMDPTATAGAGGTLEYWFGTIQEVPRHYYLVAFLVTTPPLTLLAFLTWQILNVRVMWKDERLLAIALPFWISMLVCSMTLRQGMSHYLQIIYAAVCLGAASMLWMACEWLGRRWKQNSRELRVVVLGLPVLMEGVACWNVAPYFMQYFNIFVGGPRNVMEKKMFTQSTYGEAMNPLFDYLHKYGQPGSSVLCRLGPWPGLARLNQYLGPNFPLQGYQVLDPLGAKYILRTGLERDNPYYRYLPDERRYRKKMDVLVDGGSLGEVWERRPEVNTSNLLYSDDFSTPQVSLVGLLNQNTGLNIFSSGRLWSMENGRPSLIQMKFPTQLFHGRTVVWMEIDVRMKKGSLLVKVGQDPKQLQEVGRLDGQEGELRTNEIRISSGKDVWVQLEWITTSPWNGKPATFWDVDNIEALRIFGR